MPKVSGKGCPICIRLINSRIRNFRRNSNFYLHLDMFFTDMLDILMALLLVSLLLNCLVKKLASFLIPWDALLVRYISLGWVAGLVNLGREILAAALLLSVVSLPWLCTFFLSSS